MSQHETFPGFADPGHSHSITPQVPEWAERRYMALRAIEAMRAGPMTPSHYIPFHDARVPLPDPTDGLAEQLAERGLHVLKIINSSSSLNGRRVEIICAVGQPVTIPSKDTQEDLVADLRQKVDNLVREKAGLLCRMIAQDKELAEREMEIKRLESNAKNPQLLTALAPAVTDIVAVEWPSADPFARRKDKLVSWAGED